MLIKKTAFSKFDNIILLSFFSVAIIGLILLAYRYFYSIDCDRANYFITSKHFSTDSSVEYEDQTVGAHKWAWDFGDGSPIDYRKHTFHQYKKAGIYTVKLVLNGNCTLEKTITIDKALLVDQSKVPIIIAPEAVMKGKPVYFNSKSPGAETWEWNFGETVGPDALTPSTSFTFTTVGIKKVTLIVNGDHTHIATKNIYVGPKKITKVHKLNLESYNPELPTEAFLLPLGSPKKDPLVDIIQYLPIAPKVKTEEKENSIAKELLEGTEVSEEQFHILLQQVASQSKTKEDFAKYLCEDYNFPVVKNEKEIISFSELCKKISGKKIKIVSLRLNKDQKKCITGLIIQYKVKKTIGWGED